MTYNDDILEIPPIDMLVQNLFVSITYLCDITTYL